MTSTATRAAAIEDALGAGAAYLDPALVQRSRMIIDRVVARVELGSDHTVVALVGATGSGKSSLFNALAGMDIAEVGARRPMTREPMAALWGGGGDALLDWLEVPVDRRMRRESVLDADRQTALHGLILLDLPDHDSTEAVHHVEVDRLVGMVDLMVWVVDPQKYADDALHSRYLQQLTGHAGSMIVVLNQIDKLGPGEVDTCIQDLRRLLDGDGLQAMQQLAISARRGDGVDDLRNVLAHVVRERSAVLERVGADLQTVTDEIASGLAPSEPGGGEPVGSDVFVDRLADAAGVPAIVDALVAEYRRRGWLRIGWPVLAAMRRLRPRALGRVGTSVGEEDLRVIATSLMPGSAPSQRAEVALAVDAVADASSEGLPARWSEAVHAASADRGPALVHALDEAVAGVSIRLSPPLWWRAVQAAQYLCAILAIAGAVWLFVIGAGQIFGATFDSGRFAGVPLPLLLLDVGVLGGAILTAGSAWAIAQGAASRREIAQERLRAAVDQVAAEMVLIPITNVLAAHRAIRRALAGTGAPLADAAPVTPAAVVADDDGADPVDVAPRAAEHRQPA